MKTLKTLIIVTLAVRNEMKSRGGKRMDYTNCITAQGAGEP